jgi:hypothetical protein
MSQDQCKNDKWHEATLKPSCKTPVTSNRARKRNLVIQALETEGGYQTKTVKQQVYKAYNHAIVTQSVSSYFSYSPFRCVFPGRLDFFHSRPTLGKS